MTRFRFAVLLLLLSACAWKASAQATPLLDDDILLDDTAADANNIGPAGIVPAQKGYNFSMIGTAQHDSVVGWAGLMTPILAYRFNKYLSGDASTPINVYVLTSKTTSTTLKPITTLMPAHWVPGDTALAGHLNLQAKKLGYVLTPTVTFPTGDYDLSLGTGHTQYDFTNHFELGVLLDPFVDLGIGNSTAIVDRRIERKQNSTGTNAHFEAGVSVDLPLNASFSASAYEFLPIGSQTIYSKQTIKKKGVTKTTTVASNNGLAEDNGFNTSLDIPVERHLTLSGFYSRSLRQHTDTCGGSITFQLRPPKDKDDDKDDGDKK